MKKIIILLFLINFYSAFSNTIDSLNDKVHKIEIQNIELKEQINSTNKRIDDWYTNLAIGGGIFILLIGAIITIQWSNSKGIAKEQAEKEMKDVKDIFNKEIIEVSNKKFEVTTLVQDAENMINTLKEEAKNVIKKSEI